MTQYAAKLSNVCGIHGGQQKKERQKVKQKALGINAIICVKKKILKSLPLCDLVQ